MRMRMLHPLRMEQRDLENPSCRRLSDLRQEKDAVLLQNSQSSSKVKEEKNSREISEPLKPAGRAQGWLKRGHHHYVKRISINQIIHFFVDIHDTRSVF
jgi:hypothetical protein